MKYAYLDITDLEVIPGLSRWGIPDINELKTSIMEHGIVNPLTVREKPRFGLFWMFKKKKYEIVDGAQRYKACKEIGIRFIPCGIGKISNAAVIEILAIQGRVDQIGLFREYLKYVSK